MPESLGLDSETKFQKLKIQERNSQAYRENVQDSLDRLGLDKYKDQLAVVGGAALVAYGIKPWTGDIDLVVTEKLLQELQNDSRWQTIEPGQSASSSVQINQHPDPKKATLKGATIITRKNIYSGVGVRHGDVSAFTMPLDEIYPVDSQTLIEEAKPLDSNGYRYLRPFRVLEWKLFIVKDALNNEAKRHLQDERVEQVETARRILDDIDDTIRIARWLLDIMIAKDHLSKDYYESKKILKTMEKRLF